MAYEIVFISGPTEQLNKSYLTVICAKGDEGRRYELVSRGADDVSVLAAIKALCARRTAAGVHCFCGYNEKPTPKTLMVV